MSVVEFSGGEASRRAIFILDTLAEDVLPIRVCLYEVLRAVNSEGRVSAF